MNYEQYRAFIQENYPKRHPHLFALRGDEFASPLVRAVRLGTSAALRSVVEEVHPGVFAFDMLQARFCRELLEEIDWFEQWSQQCNLELIRPNTMNRYGAILDSFGFAPFLRQLMRQYVAPFATLHYADVGGDSLDDHHGFVVAYEPGKDVSLDFHVDASEVTLNVCLGREFTGGTLYFGGVRCGQCQTTQPLPGEEFEFTHRLGRAVLHRGRHRHGANPIISGQRDNLILWCRSSRFREKFDEHRCPSWCGRYGKELPV